MTTPMTKWGIFGAGNIAHRFAADMAYSKTGNLVAVASRKLAKAQDLANRSSGVRAFDSYRALAEWEQVDAIYVATPNALHEEHCLLAIGAGKAVLCEKPFARTPSEAKAIARAAEAAGVFCMEAMWTLFLPTIGDLREKISSGALGTLTQLDVSLGFPRREASGDPITDPALGGGVLLDLGVYGVSVALNLLGPASLVGCSIVRSDTGSSRTASLILRHDRGGQPALSNISVSHASHLSNQLVVSGEKARATLQAPFIEARRGVQHSVHWATPEGDGTPTGLKSKVLQSQAAPILRRGRNMLRNFEGRSFGAGFPGSGLQFEIDAVGHCLAAGEIVNSTVPLQASIAVSELLQAAREGCK